MKFSQINHLPIEEIETSRIPGGLVAHWERAMVGQLAREVHGRGLQFKAWPTTKKIYIVHDLDGQHEVPTAEQATVLRLELNVEGVPR